MLINTLQDMARKYAPFSFEDEEDLFLQAIVGDEEAKLELLQHNSRFILKIVNTFNIKDKELYDDAQSNGMMGFLKGFEKYNPDFCVRISTYCYKYVWGEIWTGLANAKVANSIPISVYSKVCSFVKQFVASNKALPTDEDVAIFLMKQYKLDECSAYEVATITHIGVMKFNDIIPVNSEMENLNAPEDLGKNVFNSTFGNIDPSVKLTLEETADRVETYCKKNLTTKQFRIINMIVINYLRKQEQCTIREAADKLFCRYQAVDQLVKFSMLKVGVTEEGEFVKRTIKAVMELTGNKDKKSYAQI